MYRWALMLETYRRRRVFFLAHVIFGAMYAGLFLLHLYPEAPPAGPYMFMVTGIVLPLVLTMGIFGNDISSGRFRVLATEPIPLHAFYVWRMAGVVLQGAAHVAVVTGVALALHWVWGKETTEELGRWAFATMTIFLSVTAFSTSVSVVARAEANSLFAFLLLPAFFLLYLGYHSTADPFWKAQYEHVLTAGRYALPPVELLAAAADDGKPWSEVLGCGLHALGLTLVYGWVGVTLLERRSYKPQRC